MTDPEAATPFTAPVEDKDQTRMSSHQDIVAAHTSLHRDNKDPHAYLWMLDM